MFAGLVALILASAFAGAALYINVAEHPARIALPASQAQAQWRLAYQRGFLMQGTLAAVGGACALWQWHLLPMRGWLIGGGLLLANWPYTYAVMMPLNRRLMSSEFDGSPHAKVLLSRWNKLHQMRSLLGWAAVLALLTSAMGHHNA